MLQRIKSFLVWGCLTGEGSLSRQRFFRILRVCERERAFSTLDSLTHVHVSLAVSFCSAWEPWHAGVSMPPSPALDQQQDSFWLKIQMHKLFADQLLQMPVQTSGTQRLQTPQCGSSPWFAPHSPTAKCSPGHCMASRG